MSQMGQGLVGQVQSESIGLCSHRLGWSSHAGNVEVTWVADAEMCGVILQHRRV